MPTPDGPAPAGDGRRRRARSGRSITVRGTPGPRSQPFRTDNALVTAAEVVRRLAEYRPADADPRHVAPLRRGPRLRPELATRCSTPTSFGDVLSPSCRSASRAIAHACTHTTFAPTVAHGGTKTNVIPDRVDLEVDIRTLPGSDRRRGRARCCVDALGDLADAVEIESNDDPRHRVADRHAAVGRAGACHRAARARARRWCRRSWSAAPTTASSAAPARSATGSGCSRSASPFEDYATMFHGNDERVDQESLGLSEQLWRVVAEEMLT